MAGFPGTLTRALTLAERSGCPAREQRTASAAGRLRAWRNQPPFSDGQWWSARLSSSELTEQLLLAMLDESDADIAARLPHPVWFDRIDRALVSDQDVVPAEGESDRPFTALVRPLLASGRAELGARLRAVAGGEGSFPVFDPAQLAEQLYAPLPTVLDQMVLRTLVLELHNARLKGELRAADAAGRFTEFAAALGQASRRSELFHQYPVLARQLAVEVDTWLDGSARFASHLAADQARIGDAFLGGGALGMVDRVVPGLGDRHRGSTVTRVRWSGGLELMYKPRPMALDVNFRQLLSWAEGKGLTHQLRTLACLDRGDHGWMEFITASACASEEARQRFYYRQGSLLALLYLLGASDVHARNLIAVGEYPVLVDLETLVQPGVPRDTSAFTVAEVAAEEAARSSVLTVGLLPWRSRAGQAGGSVDLSGLGWSPGQQTPLAIPTVRNAGTDAIRIELNPRIMQTPAHRPDGGDVSFRLLDFADDVLAGFTEAYQLCEKNRSGLAAGPLANFCGSEVRVVPRPTIWYSTILQTAFHPDVLRDALDRERHFDALWREVPKSPVLAACVEHERADLWRNDIPIFSAKSDSAVLLDSNRRPVRDLVLVPGTECLRSRLAALGPNDLARQRWLITAALGLSAAAEADDAPAAARSAHPPPDNPEAGESGRALRIQLLTMADSIGRRLGQTAFTADDSAQWLGVNSLRGHSWSVGPLKADLYHGLTGIALFLGHLGSLTADASHTALARQALHSARCQIERGTMRGLGGMAGTGGIIYVFSELARLWSDETLLDAADQHAWQAASEAGKDTIYDFMGGSAGTIAGLLALNELRPSDRLLDQIRACADRLMATAVHSDTGIGWLGKRLREVGGADYPIAGFAHGAAGIIPSLFMVADLLGDARYRHAALKAMTYEQALNDKGAGNGDDLRSMPRSYTNDRSGLPTTWCKGAAGIGLSRLICLTHTQDQGASLQEVGNALTAVAGQTLSSHCLCHGEAGQLELYIQAASVLNNPDWNRTAENRATEILADFGRQGWKCGTPLCVETPGLLVGLAGIGYGLLRTAAPGHVSAVLALQPARYGPDMR